MIMPVFSVMCKCQFSTSRTPCSQCMLLENSAYIYTGYLGNNDVYILVISCFS